MGKFICNGKHIKSTHNLEQGLLDEFWDNMFTSYFLGFLSAEIAFFTSYSFFVVFARVFVNSKILRLWKTLKSLLIACEPRVKIFRIKLFLAIFLQFPSPWVSFMAIIILIKGPFYHHPTIREIKVFGISKKADLPLCFWNPNFRLTMLYKMERQ